MLSNRGGQSERTQHSNLGEDDVDSSYGDLRKKNKTMMNTAKTLKEKSEKVYNVDTANQKKFASLKRTSKSRFDGVQKYLHGAFLSKQLPIPTFQGTRSHDQHAGGDGQMALLNDEDLARNDSSDLLMTKVGSNNNQGKSATNLRKANVEMSQLLKNEINFSKETVERVKRGHSIFDLDIVQEAQTNKQNIVIKKPGLSQQLDHFLELSVADTTYVPQSFDHKAKANVIDLIQNSPQKKLQRVMKARLVHNLKKRKGGMDPSPTINLSPFQVEKKLPVHGNRTTVSNFEVGAKDKKSKFQSVLTNSQPAKFPAATDAHQTKHMSMYANSKVLNSMGQNRHLRESSRESNESSQRWPGRAMSDMSSENRNENNGTNNFFAQRNDSMQSSQYRSRHQEQYNNFGRHSLMMDYYDASSTQQSTQFPARNAITNLAIVRAATQIRDTLNNASTHLRNKLTPNKTSPSQQKLHYASSYPQNKYSVSTGVGGGVQARAQTEGASRLQGLKPASVNTKLPSSFMAQNNHANASSTQIKKVSAVSALSKKNGLSGGRFGSIDTNASIDSSDIEEEKLPPFLGNVETHLKREYNQFQRMFEIPINPAFFKSTNIRQPKKLQSLQSYLKDQGIASTLPQHQIDQRERSKIEYRFWKQGIDFVIPGFNDMELESRIVKFVFAIDFEKMSDKEREMLFSEPLRRHPISRQIQEQMEEFMKEWQDFLSDEAQKYMQRLCESYKLRMGKQNFKEHLIKGNLPTELMQNDNFFEHKKQLRSCKKHGKNPTQAQIQGCFTCQVLLKMINPAPEPAEMQKTPKQPFSMSTTRKDKADEDKLKDRDLDELKRVSLKELKKEVGKMPVFSLEHPPDLEKDIGETVNIDLDADDIKAGVSPFASQTTMKESGAFTDLNRSLTKQHTQSPSKHREAKIDLGPPTTVAQVSAENILRLKEETDLDDAHTKEINELVMKVEQLCKARKMLEHEQKVQAQQFGQVFQETPADVKKREEFENQFKTDVAMIFKIKARKMLVDRYNMWIRKLASDLDSLDKQVRKLTAGDLRIAKKRDGKIKFNSKRDPNKLEVFGHHDEDYDSADEDEIEKKRLFNKCFNKHNIALGRMIKTTERLQTKTKKYKFDLEKLILRSKLDRPSMIQEKFRIIWKEQDGAAQAAAENAKKRLEADESDYDVLSRSNSQNKSNQMSSFDQTHPGSNVNMGRTNPANQQSSKELSFSARRSVTKKQSMEQVHKTPMKLGGNQSNTLPVSVQSTATHQSFNKTAGFNSQKTQQQRALTLTRKRGGGTTDNFDSTPALGEQNQARSSLKGERTKLKSSLGKAQTFNQGSISGGPGGKNTVTFSKQEIDGRAGMFRGVSVDNHSALSSVNQQPSMRRQSSQNSQNNNINTYQEKQSAKKGGVSGAHSETNLNTRDRKASQSREARVKLMSIRDVLHDRQARRLRDNALQKDGYKYMLGYMARRRREKPTIDITREEVKIMNGVKILVESGYVVEESYFKHLCEVSGFDKIVDSYFKAKFAKKKIDPQVVITLSFAQKFAENLGMPRFFGLDRSIVEKREPNEVFFTLDPNLYFSSQAQEIEDLNRKNRAKLAKLDLMEVISDNEISGRD